MRAFHHPACSWTLLAVYGLTIFIQSSLPSIDLGSDLPGTDKLLHLAAYAVMGLLACRAFATLPRFGNAILLFLAGFIFVFLFGLSDEWHQSFVPGRMADGWDLLADGLGGAFGAALYAWRHRSAH